MLQSSARTPLSQRGLIGALLVGAFVFLACLIGIQTRLIFGLASVWVANGLLLGLLIRRPDLNTLSTAGFAALGFVSADLFAGSALDKAVLLSLGNLVGVYAGVFAYRFVPAQMRNFLHPLSAFYILAIILTQALAAAVVGTPLANLLFGASPLDGFEFFLISEFSFTAIVLPVALFFGEVTTPLPESRASLESRILMIGTPLFCLFCTILIARELGGIGAIAIPLPALIWCAVVLPPFIAASLNAAVASWLLWALPLAIVPTGLDFSSVEAIASLRLGVATLAIAPLAVIALNKSWMEIRTRLENTASTDALTGLLNRGAVMMRGLDALEALSPTANCAILMIDIDHFKAINDTYGHAIGDEVLVSLSTAMREELRADDLIGRLGGEEFVVIMPMRNLDEALAAAERLRHRVEYGIPAHAGGPERVTISIGVAVAKGGAVLNDMLAAADKALYIAKEGGRNRIAHADGVSAAPPAPNRNVRAGHPDFASR